MTASDGEVRLEKTGDIGEIILDRPAKHNALTPAMYREIGAVCAEADADDAVHVVIIHDPWRRLQKIREKGLEDHMSLMVDGMHNLSAPVFNSRGVLYALTSGYIGQVDQVMSPEEALAEIQTVAVQLSSALGGGEMVRSNLPDGVGGS